MPAFDALGRMWVTSLVRPAWPAPVPAADGALWELAAPVEGVPAPLLAL
jgi:hypothetical protein